MIGFDRVWKLAVGDFVGTHFCKFVIVFGHWVQYFRACSVISKYSLSYRFLKYWPPMKIDVCSWSNFWTYFKVIHNFFTSLLHILIPELGMSLINLYTVTKRKSFVCQASLILISVLSSWWFFSDHFIFWLPIAILFDSQSIVISIYTSDTNFGEVVEASKWKFFIKMFLYFVPVNLIVYVHRKNHYMIFCYITFFITRNVMSEVRLPNRFLHFFCLLRI